MLYLQIYLPYYFWPKLMENITYIKYCNVYVDTLYGSPILLFYLEFLIKSFIITFLLDLSTPFSTIWKANNLIKNTSSITPWDFLSPPENLILIYQIQPKKRCTFRYYICCRYFKNNQYFEFLTTYKLNTEVRFKNQ